MAPDTIFSAMRAPSPADAEDEVGAGSKAEKSGL